MGVVIRFPLKCISPLFPIGTRNLHSSREVNFGTCVFIVRLRYMRSTILVHRYVDVGTLQENLCLFMLKVCLQMLNGCLFCYVKLLMCNWTFFMTSNIDHCWPISERINVNKRRDRRRDTWRSIRHGPLSRRCLHATDTRQDTGPWRCSSDGTDDETRLIVRRYVVRHHVFNLMLRFVHH